MFRLLFWMIVLVVVIGPIAFVIAAFEPAPELPPSAALRQDQARQSKALIKRAREVAGGEGARSLSATSAELDGLIASAARVAPSLRGVTQISSDGMTVALSAQPPLLDALGWINFRAEIAPSETGLDVQALRLGRMALPPSVTLKVLQWVGDLVSDVPMGTLLFSSIEGVRTTPGTVTVAVNAGAGGEGSLLSRVMDGVRDAAGISDSADIARHYDAIAAAAASGALPARGELDAWLAFAVNSARQAAGDDPGAAERELRAAVSALAAICATRGAIETVTGGFDSAEAGARCKDVSLLGRSDLRKHFLLSAAFQMAGGSAVSFGAGEVKELVDGSGGGSGYSFDDVAADRAGIRWAEAAAEAAPDGLAALAEASASARNWMPSIEGLPSFMQMSEFEAKFGEVDSPAYKAQIEAIDRRIDALPLHAD